MDIAIPRYFIALAMVIGCVGSDSARSEQPPERPILALDARGHTDAVTQVIFTPDGKELITVSHDKTIRLWAVATGEPVRVLRPPIGEGKVGMIYAAALSANGKKLAVGGYGHAREIFLINLPAGRVDRVLKGHTNVIQALAFSPDGHTLASASSDGTARIWETATGRAEQRFEGHKGSVAGVSFSPDGQRLATCSFDNTARIWSVATGRTEAVLKGNDQAVRCVAWSPDGKTVATGGHDKAITLWGADGTFRRRYADLGTVRSPDSIVVSLTFTSDSRERTCPL